MTNIPPYDRFPASGGGLAFDAKGNLYSGDFNNGDGAIHEISPSGSGPRGLRPEASYLLGPFGGGPAAQTGLGLRRLGEPGTRPTASSTPSTSIRRPGRSSGPTPAATLGNPLGLPPIYGPFGVAIGKDAGDLLRAAASMSGTSTASRRTWITSASSRRSTPARPAWRSTRRATCTSRTMTTGRSAGSSFRTGPTSAFMPPAWTAPPSLQPRPVGSVPGAGLAGALIGSGALALGARRRRRLPGGSFPAGGRLVYDRVPCDAADPLPPGPISRETTHPIGTSPRPGEATAAAGDRAVPPPGATVQGRDPRRHSPRAGRARRGVDERALCRRLGREPGQMGGAEGHRPAAEPRRYRG